MGLNVQNCRNFHHRKNKPRCSFKPAKIYFKNKIDKNKLTFIGLDYRGALLKILYLVLQIIVKKIILGRILNYLSIINILESCVTNKLLNF